MVEQVKLTEKILLDTRLNSHVALSVRGCGILAQALVGKYDGHLETRRTALDFASQVIHTLTLSPAEKQLATPQVLVDVADTVITEPDATLTCTTWKWLAEGLEICSIGANTVLVFEGETISKVITPHSPYELFQSQGRPIAFHSSSAHIALKALGSQKSERSCTVEDMKVAVVPLRPTTTIAVIGQIQLAEDIIQQRVSRDDLSPFIESWDYLGRKVRTSVLISL